VVGHWSMSSGWVLITPPIASCVSTLSVPNA
jgi:hypothetical protein